ncbi:hypothetical protein [Streptomyces sp. NPDC056672]|uniref:hypothetical protein n=1 Tax=Streptomyces sp. NPDC056672 TaxID=3345906 RepID=UPI00367F6327
MTVIDQTFAVLTDEERALMSQFLADKEETAPALVGPFGPVVADLRTSALETEAEYQRILKAKNKTAALRDRVLYLLWRELHDVRQVAALLPGTVTMHTVIRAVAKCASRHDFAQVTDSDATS